MWIFASFVSLVYFTVFLCVTEQNADNDEASRRAQTPALSPEERYQDMFPLTKDNFTQSVLRNIDPWIIIFHDGSIEREWKTMATHLRGLVWVGLVHLAQETVFLKTLDYNTSQGSARVYPYGDRRTKESKWRKVGNPNEARSAALGSLPDRTLRVSGDSVPDLLLDCFTSRPSRFPAFIVTDEDETPPVFKSIAKRFEKYFAFGRVVRPTPRDLQSLGLAGVYINPPELFVIVTQKGKADKVDAIRFDKGHTGAMNYTGILEFLFTINGQFRHDLPGDNMAQYQEEMEMTDIVKIEEKRFEILRDRKKTVTGSRSPLENANSDFNFKVTRHVGMKDEL